MSWKSNRRRRTTRRQGATRARARRRGEAPFQAVDPLSQFGDFLVRFLRRASRHSFAWFGLAVGFLSNVFFNILFNDVTIFVRLASAPDEQTILAALRIVNERELIAGVEKVVVDEQIHARQENAEAGMRMVPSENPFVAKRSLHFVLDVVPSGAGESDLRGLVFGVLSANGGFNVEIRPTLVSIAVADEHATDLDRGLFEAVGSGSPPAPTA